MKKSLKQKTKTEENLRAQIWLFWKFSKIEKTLADWLMKEEGRRERGKEDGGEREPKLLILEIKEEICI